MNSCFVKTSQILSSLFSLWSLNLYANNYYSEHAIGWHWYQDPKMHHQIEVKLNDPIQQIKETRENLEKALDTALVHPTMLHVKNYIQLQNEWSEKASQFANMWQWVLLHYPKLDYSLLHPTNTVARTVYLDDLSQKQDKAIERLAKQNGLFFFYRSNCPYSKRFAPILKSFSRRYNLPVVPITLDGSFLPEFPQSRIDQGQALRFKVKAVPALFAVNPYTHQTIPISYGLISESDLRQKILMIGKSEESQL